MAHFPLEERVDKLELLLGQFIVQTNIIMAHQDRETRALKEEMRTFKEEIHNDMREFKQEMRTFKEEIHNDMREFKDENRREMREFKQEMREFKDEMREFKNEMRAFKGEMNKRWGDLANSLGRLVEDIAAPNIPGLAKQYFGCEELDFFAVRLKKRHAMDKSRRREFDVVAMANSYLFINETKVEGRSDYVDQFVKALTEWQAYFPEYADKTLVPIFGSLYLGEDVVNYLTKQKIYAMAMKEDGMALLNYGWW
jgi:hypothetical protein